MNFAFPVSFFPHYMYMSRNIYSLSTIILCYTSLFVRILAPPPQNHAFTNNIIDNYNSCSWALSLNSMFFLNINNNDD